MPHGLVGGCACPRRDPGGALRRVDVVVNNAANALSEPIGTFTEAGITKSMDVNVKGPIFLVQEFFPTYGTRIMRP